MSSSPHDEPPPNGEARNSGNDFWADARRSKPSRKDAVSLTESEWNALKDRHQEVIGALEREQALRERIEAATGAAAEAMEQQLEKSKQFADTRAEQLKEMRAAFEEERTALDRASTQAVEKFSQVLSAQAEAMGEELAHQQRLLRQAQTAEAAHVQQETRHQHEQLQQQIRSVAATAEATTRQATATAEQVQTAMRQTEAVVSRAQTAELLLTHALEKMQRLQRRSSLKVLGAAVLAMVMVMLGSLALLNWQRPGWALTERQETQIERYEALRGAIRQMTDDERAQLQALIESVQSRSERAAGEETSNVQMGKPRTSTTQTSAGPARK